MFEPRPAREGARPEQEQESEAGGARVVEEWAGSREEKARE